MVLDSLLVRWCSTSAYLCWAGDSTISGGSSFSTRDWDTLCSYWLSVLQYQAIDVPEGIRGSKGQEGKLVARQSIIRVVAVLLLLGGLMFLPFADRRSIGVMIDNQAARWAGLVLFGLGSGLVFWSGIALGRLYSAEATIQQNHHLVTSGLYRYVRHPRYLGAVLLAFGLSLTFRSWIGLVLSSAFIGLILLRIRDEEALMHKEFGQEWEVYCEHSWRLIPFLY